MSGVGAEIKTRIVGYAVTEGDFSEDSPNLPVRVGLFGEANTANQASLDPSTPVQITSIAQAAALAGWGSPIYQMAKILFPSSGGGIGGIPVIVYPQATPGGASAKVMHIAAVGTATKSGTHTVVISGRKTVEGTSYEVNIVVGDDAATIHDKITDAINNVLGAPVIASDTDYYSALTSKWKGLTAQDITCSVDTNGDDLGITYTISSIQSGAGTPDIGASLALIGNNWVTHVINGYGTVSTTMAALEAFNGRPDPTAPTGRYAGTVFKPFIAYTGSVAEDPSSITDTRLNDLTIKISPAPLSAGLPMEAAANDCLLAALVAQNTPHLDTTGKAYPDMPTPTAIGLMSSYLERNRMLLKGCSTVNLVGGQYVIQDPVTTYHPIGETNPHFAYQRIIIIDWNIRYGYLLKEQTDVVDHAIANDNDTVTAEKIIKPKIWKGILADYANDLVARALIVDAAFLIKSLRVSISTTNPDRLSTFFQYKCAGFVRVADTTVQSGFNFGSLTAN